jgi:hypothetical protein
MDLVTPERIGHGLEPKIFWSFLKEGVAEEWVLLQTWIPMGDWCRQDGHLQTE